MFRKINSLLAYLLRRKRYFIELGDGDDETHLELVLLQNGYRRPEFIVQRQLCFYKLFDLSNLKKEFRNNVLELQIKKWSPVRDYVQCVAWQAGMAEVWVTALENLPDEKSIFLPESLFIDRASGKPDAEVVSLSSGFEGRVWSNDALTDSRFWKKAPTSSEWRFFLRGAGKAIEHAAEIQRGDGFLDAPWHQVGRPIDFIELFNEKVIVSTAITLLFLVLTWQATQVYLWKDELDKLTVQYEELTDSIGFILDARARAQQGHRIVEAYNDLQTRPAIISILAIVAASLTEDEAVIEEFILAEMQLTLRLTHASLDLTEYVDAFENQAGIRSVSATRNSQRDSVTLTIAMEDG